MFAAGFVRFWQFGGVQKKLAISATLTAEGSRHSHSSEKSTQSENPATNSTHSGFNSPYSPGANDSTQLGGA